MKKDLIFEEKENGEFNLLLEIKNQGIYMLTFDNNSVVNSQFKSLSQQLKLSAREFHLKIKEEPKE